MHTFSMPNFVCLQCFYLSESPCVLSHTFCPKMPLHSADTVYNYTGVRWLGQKRREKKYKTENMRKMHNQEGMLLLFFQNTLVVPNVYARVFHFCIPLCLKFQGVSNGWLLYRTMQHCLLACDINLCASLLMNKKDKKL